MGRQEEIRAILIEERRSRGLTQREFAKLLGVSKRTVTSWETGEKMPGNMTLIDAALKRLGLSFTLGDDGEHML